MSEKIWNHNKIAYGGDYNPEQWSEDVWQEDMRLFKLAHIDTVTLNVFSWASLQPDEETYQFEKLDKIMNMVRENGLKVCLATSTAAHPAWMAKKYPEILRTEFNGMKRKFGGRHNSCPNSLVYQKYATRLASKLAERYQSYDNIIGWHISNEFGQECYCENCEKAFRVWLKKRYKTIEEVNRVWNTSFWGHTFYEFDEIVLPNLLSEHFEEERSMFQGISLDYKRFNSDSMLNCYRMEYDAVKKITPHIPVTTNLMGFYKPLDYQKWAKYMDFVSWDNYPSYNDSIAQNALHHDLIRGLKSGKPFILMEQTPSVTNWQYYNALKRPGVLRLQSYQAVAHGSDSVMFFQMRRSIGACEKYHSAVIDHCGHENTRVFREVTQIGEELDKIGDRILGAREEAKVAILFDWENWWGIELSAGPSVELKYTDEIIRYYTALHEQNIATDIISVDEDLSRYQVVIAPVLYMTKGNYDEKIREFVKQGGTFVTTYFSGYVNENDLVITGGYPGKLRDILGIWVEEIDALPPDFCNYFDFDGEEHQCQLLCDLMHLEGAEALAVYKEDFYAGMPVITKNVFGKGNAYYVGTRSDKQFYKQFIKKICKECEIHPAAIVPKGVEAVSRKTEEKEYLFLLNHEEEEKKVTLEKDCVEILTETEYNKGDTVVLKKRDVVILQM
ncbi:beta-galactosidase [[Clostridium] polysaccharolyticum]|uniref:Beta-galactosidase n=1 Tax=[Clostridium] polysaccharolyticum TaxID=29364 RepID=A0A1I0CSB0_9FIRM|nr:beta-galactosidase [[Clostridium] polysaccharolyticum]SET22466.1 beta-galactosidase [[Clostridium] polysaccharolyticum]